MTSNMRLLEIRVLIQEGRLERACRELMRYEKTLKVSERSDFDETVEYLKTNCSDFEWLLATVTRGDR